MPHLHTLPEDACEVVHTLSHQRDCVVLELLHVELGKVGLEADGRPVVRRLAGRDDGFGFDGHIP